MNVFDECPHTLHFDSRPILNKLREYVIFNRRSTMLSMLGVIQLPNRCINEEIRIIEY